MHGLPVTNVLLAGVGGQGIIRLSNILAEAAFRAGHDVKKSEIHGLSQRGGSVHGHVRFGPEVFTPVIMDGEAHFIVATEELEALRHAHLARRDGVILFNDYSLMPASISQQKATYPENLGARLAEYARAIRIPAAKIAEELGEPRSANIIMLGALAHFLTIPMDTWHNVIRAAFRKDAAEVNVRAFEKGREVVEGCLPGQAPSGFGAQGLL